MNHANLNAIHLNGHAYASLLKYLDKPDCCTRTNRGDAAMLDFQALIMHYMLARFD